MLIGEKGKTTFLKMWEADLNGKSIFPIYFNAFENDYFEDPFIAFSCEINKLLEIKFSESDKASSFFESAKDYIKTTSLLGMDIGIKYLSGGSTSLDDIRVVNDDGQLVNSSF